MKNWIIGIILFILAIIAYIYYRIKSNKSPYISDAYLDAYTGNNATNYNIGDLTSLLYGGQQQQTTIEQDFWEDPNFWLRLSNTTAGEQVAKQGLDLVSDIFGGLTSGFGLF